MWPLSRGYVEAEISRPAGRARDQPALSSEEADRRAATHQANAAGGDSGLIASRQEERRSGYPDRTPKSE